MLQVLEPSIIIVSLLIRLCVTSQISSGPLISGSQVGQHPGLTCANEEYLCV